MRELEEGAFIDELRKISGETASTLDELFELPDYSKNSVHDIFSKMKGLLAEYSEEGVNSVDLLRAFRNRG